MHPVDLGAQVLRGVLDRIPELPPSCIDDVIIGVGRTVDTQSMDLARQVVVRAGLPLTVPGTVVSSFCSSSLNAIIMGASKIIAGQDEVIIAGGVEMNSRVSNTPGVENPWLLKNYPDIYLPVGESGENICDRRGFTRQECEEIGAASQQNACEARRLGLFVEEIVPITAPTEDGGTVLVEEDEGFREGTTVEALMNLKTPFRENGRLSAGTSAQTSDGASMLVLMSKEKADALGIKPIARFVGGISGADRCDELSPAVIHTVPKLMNRLGMTYDDFDLIELNEAFASVILDVIDTLEMPIEIINPNGGAIAMGHPLGATGAILTCKAISELKRIHGRYALICMCANMGQAGALVIERTA
jgi:acetyl-CoA acyltransferase